jgi:hypothetical protein
MENKMQRGRWNEETCEHGNHAISFEDCVCIAVAESELAIRVMMDDGEPHWFPCSTISIDSEVQDYEDKGTLIVSSWIAEQEGLIGSE